MMRFPFNIKTHPYLQSIGYTRSEIALTFHRGGCKQGQRNWTRITFFSLLKYPSSSFSKWVNKMGVRRGLFLINKEQTCPHLSIWALLLPSNQHHPLFNLTQILSSEIDKHSSKTMALWREKLALTPTKRISRRDLFFIYKQWNNLIVL